MCSCVSISVFFKSNEVVWTIEPAQSALDHQLLRTCGVRGDRFSGFSNTEGILGLTFDLCCR